MQRKTTIKTVTLSSFRGHTGSRKLKTALLFMENKINSLCEKSARRKYIKTIQSKNQLILSKFGYISYFSIFIWEMVCKEVMNALYKT